MRAARRCILFRPSLQQIPRNPPCHEPQYLPEPLHDTQRKSTWTPVLLILHNCLLSRGHCSRPSQTTQRKTIHGFFVQGSGVSAVPRVDCSLAYARMKWTSAVLGIIAMIARHVQRSLGLAARCDGNTHEAKIRRGSDSPGGSRSLVASHKMISSPFPGLLHIWPRQFRHINFRFRLIE